MPVARKPILCYVTDRRGHESSRESPAHQPEKGSGLQLGAIQDSIRNAVAAGVDWIQIREKDLEGRSLLELVHFAVAETRGATTRVFVNDRLDVAIDAGAAGVHLGENSLPVESVKEWRDSADQKNFTVGVSCHSLESAVAAERSGADYIFFGPVFATPSKAEFGAPQGVEKLRQICTAVKIPVLAIGGVNLENARSCISAGVAGIAAIRLFQDSANLAETITQLMNR